MTVYFSSLVNNAVGVLTSTLSDKSSNLDFIRGFGIFLAITPWQHQPPEFLRGQRATEETFATAGEIAAASCRPVSDQRGPADYKRHLAGELTRRVLRTAVQRARHPGEAAHSGQPTGPDPAGLA